MRTAAVKSLRRYGSAQGLLANGITLEGVLRNGGFRGEGIERNLVSRVQSEHGEQAVQLPHVADSVKTWQIPEIQKFRKSQRRQKKVREPPRPRLAASHA